MQILIGVLYLEGLLYVCELCYTVRVEERSPDLKYLEYSFKRNTAGVLVGGLSRRRCPH